MVTHYKVSGHLACGSHGEKLPATTELAKSQIIQQAATAMLAQANQAPQSVLSLLK